MDRALAPRGTDRRDVVFDGPHGSMHEVAGSSPADSIRCCRIRNDETAGRLRFESIRGDKESQLTEKIRTSWSERAPPFSRHPSS
jgi:hypothetical protein